METTQDEEMRLAEAQSLQSFEEDEARRRKLEEEEYEAALAASLQSVDKAPRADTVENDDDQGRRPLTLEAFVGYWVAMERDLRAATEDIEKGALVRGGNNALDRKRRPTPLASTNNHPVGTNGVASSSTSSSSSSAAARQCRAQYGRLMFAATAEVARATKLNRHDIYVDIGRDQSPRHGIGNTVMQMAYTVGCEARGVELVPDRFAVSDTLRVALWDAVHAHNPSTKKTTPGSSQRASAPSSSSDDDDAARNNTENETNETTSKVGEQLRASSPPLCGAIELIEGDLVEHKPWCAECDVAFVNNFNDIFNARSGAGEREKPLDDHVASIFAAMKPGARLLALHPLHALGASRSEANARRKDVGKRESPDASYFERETLTLRPARDVAWRDDAEPVASWCKSPDLELEAYLYTRVRQQSIDDGKTAAFLCTNRDCAFPDHPTAALDDDGALRTECAYCQTPRRAAHRRAAAAASSSGGPSWRSRGGVAASAPKPAASPSSPSSSSPPAVAASSSDAAPSRDRRKPQTAPSSASSVGGGPPTKKRRRR